MKQISETPPIDWLFYVEFRKTGLWVIALLCVLTLGGVLLQWAVFEDFFAGMVVGCLLMWLTLNFWARVFFGAADRAIGLQRMLLCAILGLPLGIIVTFGVVQYWPNWALGFGFGVSSPVFYAIGPIWRLRNHEAHEEQIP